MGYFIGWQSKRIGLHHGVHTPEFPRKDDAERAIKLLGNHSTFEYWVQDNPKASIVNPRIGI